MITHISRSILFGATAALILSSTAAMAQAVPTQSGDITYVTGGIGRDETAALKSMQGSYNLHVMSSSTSGHFVGDTPITITNSKGETVLTTTAGPIFYAKLPAGTYTVEANRNGDVKKQRVTVGAKFARINFAWPYAPEDTVTIRGEASSPPSIPPLGTTVERSVGTTITEPVVVPNQAPAPVYQATPTTTY